MLQSTSLQVLFRKFFCTFCKLDTTISTNQRKISFFTKFPDYPKWLVYYNKKFKEMPFLFWCLDSHSNTKLDWKAEKTPEFYALYDAYMGKIMLLHLSARLQCSYLSKMGPKLNIVNVGKVSEIDADYVSINQSLTKFGHIQFPKRGAIIKALLGFVTKIVTRIALEPCEKTHSDGTDEIFQIVNLEIVSLILRRILSQQYLK
jgi:hypothetical protein